MQLRGFERQFELVRRSGLPAFLHSRAAAPDMLAALRRHAADMRASGVVHSFDGSAEEAASLLELPDIYIGAEHSPARWIHSFCRDDRLMRVPKCLPSGLISADTCRSQRVLFEDRSQPGGGRRPPRRAAAAGDRCAVVRHPAQPRQQPLCADEVPGEGQKALPPGRADQR